MVYYNYGRGGAQELTLRGAPLYQYTIMLSNLRCHNISSATVFIIDPAYQQPVSNLDGCEGHSEHILFGTNVDISEDQDTEDAGQGESETLVQEVGAVNEEEPVQDQAEGHSADSNEVTEETEEHT